VIATSAEREHAGRPVSPAPSCSASASGASRLCELLGGHGRSRRATRHVEDVQMSSEPTIAIGRSRPGLLDSSLPVETASKPM
jgi:hypothetical protein